MASNTTSLKKFKGRDRHVEKRGDRDVLDFEDEATGTWVLIRRRVDPR